ncbi:uncharacterized protein BJ171DRAFT_582322 [Polychytrium aggregatum]|uniref:uncharacterized protein n=1 Tax=Polychytrium aggregatum TaxID=110093 RepID=UPI0022FEA59A|nr:uncharacterized protein BJ171DRAFT_582322 [Polychytrium aggregatum]KAI9203945.1 hypothetical protein BJ171DRAFT_582322 [Polychytrium aggregatum]
MEQTKPITDPVDKEPLCQRNGLIQELKSPGAQSNTRLKSHLRDTFGNLRSIYNVFIPAEFDLARERWINIRAVVEWFNSVPEASIDLGQAVIGGIVATLDDIKNGRQSMDETDVVVLLIILSNPMMMDPDYSDMIMPKLCTVLGSSSQSHRLLFGKIVSNSVTRSFSSREEAAQAFLQIVGYFQQTISKRIAILRELDLVPSSRDDVVVAAIRSMELLYCVNEVNGFVPYYEFYNPSVEDKIELKDDYRAWKEKDGFSLFQYPFLLSTSTKSEILKIESLVSMRRELQDAFFRALFIGVNSPYLQLDIRREHILRDAMYQLASKPSQDLKKQLRVSFVGEEGIDEGGVQKEFFQLIFKELFDPNFGMFTVYEDSRVRWFSRGLQNDPRKLLGLAIYNGVVLDLQFPTLLYKKLLGGPMNLRDLCEVDPDLGKGLQQLLECSDDVEEVYSRTFQVEYETITGEIKEYELVKNGSQRSVTNSNRQEFVDLYVDFLLNQLVSLQFTSLRAGFDTVMSGSAMELFRPEELQELVCGSPTLDFNELEAATQYDGYDKDSLYIRDFWSIVHTFDDEMKKRLLFFATGSDRVPIGGLAKLQFVIAKNGGDSELLPTSHTCFNVLLLSEYGSKSKLQRQLEKALENSHCGFFLN